MTTTTEESVEKKPSTDTNINNALPIPPSIPKEIMSMMEYLSRNANIIFKSQQRNEPELHQTEKLKLALDVYQRNPQTFLIRFGNYLEDVHLQDFARLSIADSDDELHKMVQDYQNKLKTRQRDVKNRRYTALQKLIEEGEYFSEQEMMKRQPELYEELVGQYLSNKEKQQRDSYDVRNTTFSGILMHNLEQTQLNEIMKSAQNCVANTQYLTRTLPMSSFDHCIKEESFDNLAKEDEIPLNFQLQWGNFDNEQIACSSSKLQIKKSLVNSSVKPTTTSELIMADERELLRQEFISQMHEQFLTGQDKDFDYATVDDNTQFDDLLLISQDNEDKYFEESDDDDVNKNDQCIEIPSLKKIPDSEESEDELDTYMSHLSKHHSLQECSNKY